MPSTLSLSCSKRLYTLLDEYDTEQRWIKPYHAKPESDWHITDRSDVEGFGVPAPSFAELVRVLPVIAELKGFSTYNWVIEIQNIVYMYMRAQSDKEGMKQVSDYLEASL